MRRGGLAPALSRCMRQRAALIAQLSNRRTIIITPIMTKVPVHCLALISAAVLLYANNGLAADSVGDAQMQARDLLAGTVNGRDKAFDASHTNPAGGHRAPEVDPQEQARRLVLGKPTVGVVTSLRSAAPKTTVSPTVSAGGKRQGYSDPQKSAQRMILGNRPLA